jgi:hypothetical protein
LKLKKNILICLFSFSVCSRAIAECEQPLEEDYSKHGHVSYNHTHRIYEPVEKSTRASDVLEIWEKLPQELCFNATFVTDNYHMCFVGGKAIKSKANEYSYSENKCRITLNFKGNKVMFIAKGSLGDGCSTDDLNDQNGCGFNTSIDSAVFTKESKTLKK